MHTIASTFGLEKLRESTLKTLVGEAFRYLFGIPEKPDHRRPKKKEEGYTPI